MAYLATIKPDRITVRYKPDVRFGDGAISLVNKMYNTAKRKESIANLSQNSLNNLGKKKSSIGLSKHSKRNIQDSIQLLHTLSPERKVMISKNRYIYNFKCAFITLTLPSKQVHSDVEIKQCLDRFLTTLRKKYNLNNYVWKAELQANTNIHFHIVVDIYIPSKAVNYYWNKVINKLGYVDAYSNRMSQLSLLEYSKLRGKRVEEVKGAYLQGVKSSWKNPNSTDTKSILTKRELSFYLSKYLTKPINKSTENDIIDSERIANFGKVWARSTSLSKIKLITRWDWNNIKSHIKSFINTKNIVTKVYDYCTVYYLNLKEVSSELYQFISGNIIRQAKFYNYPFPIPNST